MGIPACGVPGERETRVVFWALGVRYRAWLYPSAMWRPICARRCLEAMISRSEMLSGMSGARRKVRTR